MTYDEEKITIDAEKMFPEAARRVKILEELKNSWPSVVGLRIARYSKPAILGVNELVVSALNSYAADSLSKMKGNILRALSVKWNYQPSGEFSLKIEFPKIQKYKASAKNIANHNIKVSDDKVNEYMSNAPETLPYDINYALSHLKAFFDQKHSA